MSDVILDDDVVVLEVESPSRIVIESYGARGPSGADGAAGIDGVDGTDGASAYEVAVDNGFVGTESDWLDSLIGPEGPEGPQGPQGDPGSGSGSGLSGFQLVNIVDGVADVASAVAAGVGSLAIAFASNDPVEIKLPEATSSEGPSFVLSFSMVGENIDPTIIYSINDVEIQINSIGDLEVSKLVGTAANVKVYSWSWFPTLNSDSDLVWSRSPLGSFSNLRVNESLATSLDAGEHLVIGSIGGQLEIQAVSVTPNGSGDSYISLPKASDHKGQFFIVTGSNGSNPIGIAEVDDTPTAGFMNFGSVMGAIITAAYGTVLDLTTATLGSPLFPIVWVDGGTHIGSPVNDVFDFTGAVDVQAEVERLSVALLGHILDLVTVDEYGEVYSLTTGPGSEVRFSDSMSDIAGVDLAATDGDVPGYLGKVRAAGDGTTGLGVDLYYDDTEWLLEGVFGIHNMPNSSSIDHKSQIYFSAIDESSDSENWDGYKWTTLASNYRLELLTSQGYYTLVSGPKLNQVLYQIERNLASIRLVTASVVEGSDIITLTDGSFDSTLDDSAVITGWNSVGITHLLSSQAFQDGYVTILNVNSSSEAQISANAIQSGSFEFAVARPVVGLVEHLLQSGGADGLSAYEVAVENGFVGDESDWLDSLVGATGAAGAAGATGATGADGAAGRLGPGPFSYSVGDYIPLFQPFGSGAGSGGLSGSVGNSNNTATYAPFEIRETTSIDELTIGVTAANAGASAVVRLGVYSDNGGVPGTVLVDAGTASLNSTGLKRLSFTEITLAPGFYWFVVVSQSLDTGGSNPAFVICNPAGSGSVPTSSTPAGTTSEVTYRLTSATVTGALSNNPTTIIATSNSGRIARVWAKVSAL